MEPLLLLSIPWTLMEGQGRHTDPLAPSPSTQGRPPARCITCISPGSMAQGSLRRALSAPERACASEDLPRRWGLLPPFSGPGEGGPHSRPAQSKLRLRACPSNTPARRTWRCWSFADRKRCSKQAALRHTLGTCSCFDHTMQTG